MKLNPKHLVPASARERVRKQLKFHAYDHTYPAVYRKAAEQPVDPRKVVFVDSVSLELTDNMKLVYDQLCARGFTCEFLSLMANSGSYAIHDRQCRLMAQAVATARLVFISDTCAPLACLPLRSQTKVVQLWHACGAFKRFGMSTADKLFGTTRDEKLRHPEHRNTSLITVSSPEVRWAYIEAMCMEQSPEVVQALGVSRTDLFFNLDFVAEQRNLVAQTVEQAIANAEGKKILLYAPTFRGRVFGAQAPTQLSIPQLRDALHDDYVLLVKQHPFVKDRPPIPAGCEDFAADISDELPIEACLCAADACITDYSSLVFEYALFNRPMVFFAPDKDDYDDWRGFYYDYDELTPGPVCTATQEVIDYIRQVEQGFDPSEVTAFRKKFMSSCDGHATDRILAAVLGEDADAPVPVEAEPQEGPAAVPVRAQEGPAAASANVQATQGPMPVAGHFDMSVIVPVYNAVDHLRRCVASLDAQTVPQDFFEVVLVDDGSTDKSLELAYELAATRPNYTVLTQANAGVSAARNAGIRAACGRYLMFLDADDTLGEQSIASLVQAFDSFGDAVDLVTYPLTYVEEGTGATHGHMRYRWLKQTGVYDLAEYPFLAQSTPNVCVRNSEDDTPLFPAFLKMGEDQYFNTQVLARRGAIGFCTEAQYFHTDHAGSSSASGDEPRFALDDMIALYSMLVELAQHDEHMAAYAYALVLYNIGWRTRKHLLLPNFGNEVTRAANYERLGGVLKRVPLWAWEQSPYLSDEQRVWLMQRFGVVDEVQRVSCLANGTRVTFDDGQQMTIGLPKLRVYWAVREDRGLRIKCLVHGIALRGARRVELAFACGDKPLKAVATPAEGYLEDQGVPVANAWDAEVLLPTMDKPYEARVTCLVDGRRLPRLGEFVFDLCRTNSRRINVCTREFGDRRLVITGTGLRVGTVWDLPTWTMPAAQLLMQQRDKTRTGDFDAREVSMLRDELPKAWRALAGTCVWVYVNAREQMESDERLLDGVVRLDLAEIEGFAARVALLLLAKNVVSSVSNLEDVLPCDSRTWDRIADLTASQTWTYVGCDSLSAINPYDS